MFRCGELQLHLVENDAEAPAFNHLALHVSDFEAVYRAVSDHEDAEFMALPHVEAGFVDGEPPVYVRPPGATQRYLTSSRPVRGEIPPWAVDDRHRTGAAG